MGRTHADAIKQLADPAALTAIASVAAICRMLRLGLKVEDNTWD